MDGKFVRNHRQNGNIAVVTLGPIGYTISEIQTNNKYRPSSTGDMWGNPPPPPTKLV